MSKLWALKKSRVELPSGGIPCVSQFPSRLPGDQYYLYEFRRQPSHEECAAMNTATPSLLFSQYTDLLCDQTLEEMLAELFGTACKFSCFSAVSVVVHFSFHLWLPLIHSRHGVQSEVPSHPRGPDWRVGTGVASGPQSTLLSWDGSTSVQGPRPPLRGGEAVRGGGPTGSARNGEGRVAKRCLKTCSALTTIFSTTAEMSQTTFLPRCRIYTGFPCKMCIFSWEVCRHWFLLFLMVTMSYSSSG